MLGVDHVRIYSFDDPVEPDDSFGGVEPLVRMVVGCGFPDFFADVDADRLSIVAQLDRDAWGVWNAPMKRDDVAFSTMRVWAVAEAARYTCEHFASGLVAVFRKGVVMLPGLCRVARSGVSEL